MGTTTVCIREDSFEAALGKYKDDKSRWLGIKSHQQAIVDEGKPFMSGQQDGGTEPLEPFQVESLEHIREILDFLFKLKMKKLKNEQDFFESRRRGKLESLIINPVIDCMEDKVNQLGGEANNKDQMLNELNQAKTFFNADKNFKKETYFRNGINAQRSTSILHEAFKARCQSEFKATVYQDKPAKNKQKLLEILREYQKMTSVSMFWRCFGYSRTAVQKLVIENLSNHLQQDVAIDDETFRLIDGNWSSGNVVEKEKELKSLLVVLPCGASSDVTSTGPLKCKLRAHLDDFIKRTRGWGVFSRTPYQQEVISSFEGILEKEYDNAGALAEAVQVKLHHFRLDQNKPQQVVYSTQSNNNDTTDSYEPKDTPLFDAFSADITSLITPSLQASISSRNDDEPQLTGGGAFFQANNSSDSDDERLTFEQTNNIMLEYYDSDCETKKTTHR